MLAETEADTASSDRHSAHVGHSLHWPQNHELAQLSIPDLLSVVARNALAVIPAERCVIFMYDKSTNLLSSQVSLGVGELADESKGDIDDELSFPPVMGMVSACFLQRRCLRMQEPHLHKAFHRDYDVPKDMKMDSMIAAPVTLHHRTVGVIQLINRVDPDGPWVSTVESPLEEFVSSQPSERELAADEEVEVKLMRAKTVARHVRTGFSAKVEQKMIQFTSHVAQLLDNKLKLLAQTESTAKLRDEQAKSALELLEMMNQKLEYKQPDAPTELPTRSRRPTVPIRIAVSPPPLILEDFPLQTDHEFSTVELPPVDLLCGVDMMKVMIGISRTQAIFRGNHLRKVHRLSEALHEHRLARKRVRSALVIQRATRRFLSRKWRKQRRNAVWTIVRAIKSYKARAALAERIAVKRTQRHNRSVVVEAKPREGAHHTLVVSEVHRFRKRHDSAIRIQQHFRGHQVRKEVEKVVGFRNFSKGLKNIVKLQSLLRGSIARKKVERIREEKRAACAANIVCMRLASTESASVADSGGLLPEPHRVSNSRDCIYPLPVSCTGAYVVVSRCSSVSPREECWGFIHATEPILRTSILPPSHHLRRRRLIQPGPIEPATESIDIQSVLRPLSRPLAPYPVLSPRVVFERQPQHPADYSTLSRAELARQFPSVVFEVDSRRAKRCPPGVQQADDWLPKRPHRKISSPQRSSPRSQNQSVPGELPRSRNQKSGQLPNLPCPLPRLQVCFLPAGNARRKSTAPAEMIKPPRSQTPVLLPATSQRRPHTTR